MKDSIVFISIFPKLLIKPICTRQSNFLFF